MTRGRSIALAGAIAVLVMWAAILFDPYAAVVWFDKIPIKILLATLCGLLILTAGLLYHWATHMPSAKKATLSFAGVFTIALFAGVIYPTGVSSVEISPEKISFVMSDYNGATAWVAIACGFLLFLTLLLFVGIRAFEFFNECEL